MIVALLLMIAMPMMAERVSPETAQKVAQTFLNNNGAKAAQLTDLSKIAGFQNLYIFTAEQGFVVMAADDCVQPILGYSFDGHFSTNDMPESFRWWLQGYSDEIQFAIDSKAKPSAETAKQWKDLINGNSKAGRATTVVAPLIQTKWNQNKYYNNLCPAVSDGIDGKAFTGCVATAMAQIMKYWSYPSSGIGSHSYTWREQTLSANFGETTYDWNNMADYYEYYYVNGTDPYAQGLPEPSEVEISAVATLMYHCGVSVEMNYGGNSTGGSGAANYYVANALKTYFNYKNTAQHKQKSYNSTVYYTDSQWIAMLKEELNANRPVQYGGQDPNSNSGHAFVCDGYNSDDYFHFNWGWAGHYNGYFSINNLDTGAYGEAGSGNGVYTRDQEAVIGIEPSSMLPAPTNLAYTINGLNEIVLTWDAVSAAASYNVYCDGNLIGNTAENTYSETAQFGTHNYFVRCVDANSQLSLLSNTVTVTIDYPTPIVTDLTATLSGNNANLSWTAPEWCYPETPSATLTYGAESSNSSVGPGSTGGSFYWGNRHLANDLSEYDGKTLYKVSFYVNDPGAYECYIFKGTGTYSSYTYPSEEIAHFTTTASSTGWIDLDLDETIVIESSQDLWVFIYDPVGRAYPAVYSSFSQHTNGGYYSLHYPITSASGYLPSTFNNAAWLIKAYVTDGTYTYNLYQDGNPIAQNISQTSYDANLNDNAANLFTVKTNYYGGETTASNAIGFAKGTASVDNLEMAANDQMTVTEGSKLTVTGTLSNDNAENLIIENSAQLIHNTDNVKATVKKTIEAYTADDNGWNFIASPVTESFEPSTDNGLLANNYDLYLFDQSQDKEWRNIKAGAFGTINHKMGYLYANNTNTTLTFAGTLAATAEPADLDYDGNATLKGFNLVGNPYPCNATVTNDFYIIDENNMVSLAEEGREITPCEGVFVKATDTDQTVTFSKANSAKGVNSKDCFDLVVSQGRANIDRARVRFGEGIGMEKYSLDRDKGSKIALWQEGQEYAVAYTNGQDEMPLNFKATQNGMYSISIEANSLDLDYLHLIDNLTGNDVDLLATPNYTFEANTTDYASRFRLLFAPAEEIEVATEGFAFFADGHLHVFNQGNARLQFIDMTGHILLAETLQGSLDKALDLVPGVYVVRLISEKDTRSMKIVVD
jgi:hypothetical protein